MSNQAVHTNCLANEKSPYLLQHAHNPVNWYPWGKEAFETAKRLDRPIFLSVGYSTCHWCHVMERESFENEDIAKLLNDNFVSIKVDREERPDVDRLYMSFVTSLTGSGGWPMSVFLTPDLEPFFGGTYFPPHDSFGRIGFPNLLTRISVLWQRDKDKAKEQAKDIAQEMKRHVDKIRQNAPRQERVFTDKLYTAVRLFESQFDDVNGGFSSAPKFPRPVELFFLLDMYSRLSHECKIGCDKNKEEMRASVKHMVEFSLTKMCNGGLFDHLSGGFHRYSVDKWWHVSHFEKMLYDQAQLACALLDAYPLSLNPLFLERAEQTLQYVQKYMTSPEGGFYSAEDADSPVDFSPGAERKEGLFYIWDGDDVRDILESDPSTQPHANMFLEAYGIKNAGNIRKASDPIGELMGYNVLYVAATPTELSEKYAKSEQEVNTILSQCRDKLLIEREKRPRPHLDDKIITAWCGLMISAFSKGYAVTGNRSYLQSASCCASFILNNLYTPSQEHPSRVLYRSYRQGRSPIPGFLADYAFFINGLLDLYEACGDANFLESAEELQQRQIELMWDEEAGNFFDDSGLDQSIIVRMKEEYDSAEPSGNSVSALNLIRLGLLTNNTKWASELPQSIINHSSHLIKRAVSAVPMMLCALNKLPSQDTIQVVVSGSDGREETNQLIRSLHTTKEVLLTNKVIFHAGSREAREYFNRKGDNKIKDMINDPSFPSIDDQAKLYLCVNYSCQKPTSIPHELQDMLVSLTSKK